MKGSISRLALLVASLLAVAALEARAEGFATKNLAPLAERLGASLGSGFQHKAAPERVTLFCPTCEAGPMIDVLMGRQTDGTEDRIRSGETSFAHMERLCRQKSPTCRLVKLDVAPAVGWITTYPIGGASTGSTAVVLRDGDMLTVRSIAANASVARRNAETVVRSLTPQLVKR